MRPHKSAVFASAVLVSLGLLAGCAADTSGDDADVEAVTVPAVEDSTVTPSCKVIIAGKDETANFPCEAKPGSGAGGGGGGSGFTPIGVVQKQFCVSTCARIHDACVAGCDAEYASATTLHTRCVGSCGSRRTACVKDCR